MQITPLPPLPPVPDYQPTHPILKRYDDTPKWRYPHVWARHIGDPALWQPHLAQKADPIIDAMYAYLTAYADDALPNWRIYPWEPNTVGLPRGGYFYPSPKRNCPHCDTHLFASDVDSYYHRLHPLLLIPLMYRTELQHSHRHIMTTMANMWSATFTDFQHRYGYLSLLRRDIQHATAMRAPFIRRLDALDYDEPAPSGPDTVDTAAQLDTPPQNRLLIEL